MRKCNHAEYLEKIEKIVEDHKRTLELTTEGEPRSSLKGRLIDESADIFEELNVIALPCSCEAYQTLIFLKEKCMEYKEEVRMTQKTKYNEIINIIKNFHNKNN